MTKNYEKESWHKQMPCQITLEDMKAEIVREIAVRRRVYPNWYESGKLSASVGEYRLLVLECVALELDKLIRAKSPHPNLFDNSEVF